jgi:phage-related protein
MTIFPQLKTGAVAQYPMVRRQEFRNQTVRFVDGSEQRYRDSAGVRQSWQVALSGLDEHELAAIEEFFVVNQGSFGSFQFTDPWDGQVYDDCSLLVLCI